MNKISKPTSASKAIPPKPLPKEVSKLEVVKLINPLPQNTIAEPKTVKPTPADQTDSLEFTEHLQPIPSPTDKMQYRAIGVIYGRYFPTEEQFSKGVLTTVDGTVIDAVVLGKVMPILKKRLNLAETYPWIVYPRTMHKVDNTTQLQLHVQIAGVWAPVEMGKSNQDIDPGVEDGYFSIRGEVVEQSLSANRTTVKIKRSEQKQELSKTPTKFKLSLAGILPNNPVGYFWDIKVQRCGDILNIAYGKAIAPVPKKPPRKPMRKDDSKPQFKPKPLDGNKDGNKVAPKPLPKSVKEADFPRPIKRPQI